MPPNEIAEAYIALRASTAGFAQQAKNDVTSELRGARESATVPIKTEVLNRAQQEGGLKRDIGGMVKNVAAYAGGIFAAQKIFDFGKSVVSDAASVQKSQEAIQVEFGKSAAAVNDFSVKSASALGIAEKSSVQYSASYGRVLENLGMTPAASAKMSVGFQKVIGTLSAIKGVDPTTALDKMNTALATGSVRALRPLGIAFDSTQIKAEALKLGLAGITGPSQAVSTASLKMEAAQAAYNKVLESNPKSSLVARTAADKLALAHQGLAAAASKVSGTLTGSEKDQALYGLLMQHNAQYTQLAKAHSGDYANQLIELHVQVENAKAAIGEALLPVVTAITGELIKGVKFLSEYKTEIVGIALAVGAGLVAWGAIRAAMFAYSIGVRIATINQMGLNAAISANPIGVAVVAVAALAFGLYELYQHSATARRIMNETWADIKKYGVAALHEVGHVIHEFVAEAKHLWAEYGNDVKFVWHQVEYYVKGGIQLVKDYINIGLAIIHGDWKKAWQGVEQLARDVWPLVKHTIRLGILGLEDLGGWILSEAKKLGIKIVKGVISGVGSLAGDLKSAVEDKVGSALSSLNPFSPVEHGAQMYISDPIIKGTVQGLDPLHGELQGAIVSPLISVMGHAQTIGVQQGVMLGTDIARNTVNGTHGLQLGLTNAIVVGAKAALVHAKAALGISSPSSLYANQIGKPLAEGIVHGMGGLEQALAAKVTAAARSAMSAAGGFSGGGPQGTGATGANQVLGRQMMLAAGWGADQWGALQALWTRESGWSANAVNPSSGAYGIPQSLGHGHPYNLGDARAQIAWGLDYIRGRYGSPSAAWAHETSVGWYGGGGRVPGALGAPQAAVVHGGELILTPQQERMLMGGRGVHVDQIVVVEAGDPRAAADTILNQIAARAV